MRNFGRPVIYTPASTGIDESIPGVFDAAHQVVDLATGEQSDLGPTLGIRLADLSVAPKQDDRLVVDGTTYQVNDVRPDGQGGALLPLRKVL